MRTIKEILMDRDGMSEQDADNLIEDAKEELQYLLEQNELAEAEDICKDFFGLEPDYLFELL